MSSTPPTMQDAARQMRLLDRMVLLFPVFLILAIVVMIWSLQSNVDQQREHPSIGIYHPGEYATENGVSGTIELELEDKTIGDLWRFTVRFMDQEANPINLALVAAHGVDGGRYMEVFECEPVKGVDGAWSGEVLLPRSANSIMIHLDLPQTKGEDWVAEWTPKGRATANDETPD